MQRRPEEMRKDPGMELWVGMGLGAEVEFLIDTYDIIYAAGIHDVAKHDLTSLKSCFTKAEFEKLEHSDLEGRK